METNVSVEAGADDPVVVVPWADETGVVGYVEPDEIGFVDRIAEAREWPEVRAAMLTLNAAGSAVWTLKCDAWVLDDEEKQLDFGLVEAGFAAYFDVAVRGCEELTALRARVQAWSRAARTMPPRDGRADFVIRPAVLHGEDGFVVTVYVFGYGRQAEEAGQCWADALAAVSGLLAAQ